jgi:hypothetical protein
MRDHQLLGRIGEKMAGTKHEYPKCLNCGYETEYVSNVEYCYSCEQAYLKGYEKGITNK